MVVQAIHSYPQRVNKMFPYEDPTKKCSQCNRDNLLRSFGLPFCPDCNDYADDLSKVRASWLAEVLENVYEKYHNFGVYTKR